MPHPVDVHVGRRIRQARMVKGQTQQRLGERLGISFQQIQKYENGANRVGCSRLWEISQILDLPVSFFFEGVEDVAAGKHDNDFPRRILRLASDIEAIPDKDLRDQILSLIRICSRGGPTPTRN